MSDQGGLQLLPETRKKIIVKVPGENRLIIIAGVILVLILAGGFGLNWYNGSLEEKIAAADTQMLDLEKQRDKENEQKLLLFSKQSAQVGQVLRDHLFWTRAFLKIETLLQNQIQLETVSATVQGNQFEVKGIAANYTVVARQLASFLADDSISDVSLKEILTTPTGKMQFSMKIIFKPEKFLRQ